VLMFIEFTVLITTLTGMLLGSCCIYWVKVRPSARRAWWGCCLFVVTLLTLGAVALVAAMTLADGLAPLGLLSGLLIVGMLWESPVAVVRDDTTPNAG
jgi:hypothetical protein